MYVDPNTLTDKQKKDTKFMSEVCTELTPEILAKAATSLINNVLNVKYRVVKPYPKLRRKRTNSKAKTKPSLMKRKGQRRRARRMIRKSRSHPNRPSKKNSILRISTLCMFLRGILRNSRNMLSWQRLTKTLLMY